MFLNAVAKIHGLDKLREKGCAECKVNTARAGVLYDCDSGRHYVKLCRPCILTRDWPAGFHILEIIDIFDDEPVRADFKPTEADQERWLARFEERMSKARSNKQRAEIIEDYLALKAQLD